MNLAELILAVSLLNGTAPEEWREPAQLRAQFPTLRFAVMGLALEWEILDPRETRYMLARAEDFPTDLAALQGKYQELRDAPPLCDAMRFPDKAIVNELLSFNRSYRSYVEICQPMEMAYGHDLRAVQREIDHLYQVWDTVRDSRCEYYYVTVRRLALKRLRELIGDEAYYQGQLPPHVPIWRFQELR